MIGQHSKAGAAGKVVPNAAAVRKPLHRSRASATLAVPGQPKMEILVYTDRNQDERDNGIARLQGKERGAWTTKFH